MLAHNLLETQELYQVVINNLSDGIYLVDKEKNVLIWNDAAEKITGYAQEEMISQSCGIHILDHIDRTGAPLIGHGCPISATLRDGRQRINELFLRHKRGYRVPVLLKTVPIMENDEVTSVMAVFTDNSVHVQQNDLVSSLTKLVMTDQLTGLSNRRHTETILETKLEDFRLYGVKFSVLFMNLDDFAECNSKYGYEIGNRMLITLADSFRRTIRDTDFVGRWAGEEFIGIFETKSALHLKSVTEKMRVLIEQTQMEYMGKTIGITASIGATMACSSDGSKGLIERANSLMHVSKISGKNCVTIG